MIIVELFVHFALDRFLGGPAMARIAEAEIERLKTEVSLVRLVESSGVKLARRRSNGRWLRPCWWRCWPWRW